jgi:hypothetical protein
VLGLKLDELPMPELELELEPLDMPLLVEPVPDVVESEPGAGVGVGAVEDDEDDGALGEGAGAGVTTFSSFLQAVRPIARIAASRSERFMIFPLGEHHTGFNRANGRSQAALPAAYPIVMNILPARRKQCLRPAYKCNTHRPAM